jgi:hypothetical protein
MIPTAIPLEELVRILGEEVKRLGPLRTTVPVLPAYFHPHAAALAALHNHNKVLAVTERPIPSPSATT